MMEKRLLLAGSCAGIILATVVYSFGQQSAEVKEPLKASEAPQEVKVLEPVMAGFGTIKLDGLLQGWYQFTDGGTPEDTFRLRRAEIRLSGEITPTVPWTVMIDPAQVREDDTKSSSISGTNYITSVGRKSVLQDFLITIKVPQCPLSSSIDIGQYKIPFGMEGLEPSAKLDLIERSLMSSQLKWSDLRDVGVTWKAQFTCPLTGAKIRPAIGVYNGEGQNRWDGNNPMAVAGRLSIEPVESLHLGIAHYDGEKGLGATTTEDKRTGAELKFGLAPLAVSGEYAIGESDGKDKETYYATVVCDLCELSQAVVRYDWYDPDTDVADDAKSETSVGLNYFIKKHNAKLAVNYVFVGEESASVDNDIVRVLAQVSF